MNIIYDPIHGISIPDGQFEIWINAQILCAKNTPACSVLKIGSKSLYVQFKKTAQHIEHLNFKSDVSDIPGGQNKKHSLIESFSNTAIGYGVAVASQIIIFPFYGIHIPMSSNFTIGIWFTFISVIRSYVLRRWFNKIMVNTNERKHSRT